MENKKELSPEQPAGKAGMRVSCRITKGIPINYIDSDWAKFRNS